MSSREGTKEHVKVGNRATV